MGSRVHKYHGRVNRNQRLKRQRIINIITLIFVIGVGSLILGMYGVLPLPEFMGVGQVEISSNHESNSEPESKEEIEPVVPEITEPAEIIETTETVESTETPQPVEDIQNEAVVPNILEKVNVDQPMIALTMPSYQLPVSFQEDIK